MKVECYGDLFHLSYLLFHFVKDVLGTQHKKRKLFQQVGSICGSNSSGHCVVNEHKLRPRRFFVLAMEARCKIKARGVRFKVLVVNCDIS